MAFIIGLTGGIASGKSTVSNMFKELNIPVVDADQEARLAVEKGERAYNEIIAYFGEDILHEDGSINRSKLGSIIFPDEEKRNVLNSITHPAIRERVKQKKDEYVTLGHNPIVLDIPLFFESKSPYEVDKVMIVYVDEHTQIARLMVRNGYSEEEALSRIASQMPLNEKRKLADAVIDNSGTVEETKRQMLQILKSWGFLL